MDRSRRARPPRPRQRHDGLDEQQPRERVRHEVRVGLKPQIDLLNAEREAAAAAAAAAQARTARIVAAYRLRALIGSA